MLRRSPGVEEMGGGPREGGGLGGALLLLWLQRHPDSGFLLGMRVKDGVKETDFPRRATPGSRVPGRKEALCMAWVGVGGHCGGGEGGACEGLLV